MPCHVASDEQRAALIKLAVQARIPSSLLAAASFLYDVFVLLHVVKLILCKHVPVSASIIRVLPQNFTATHHSTSNPLLPLSPELRAAQQEYKRIDVLILNAVVNPTMGPLLDTPPAAMDKVLSVNIKAAISLVAAAKPHLGPNAAVLFVTSITAFRASTPISAYAVSKTALLGVVKALAAEMGSDGVRVNGIAPGIVPTKFSSALVATGDLRQQQVQPRPPAPGLLRSSYTVTNT